MTNDAQSALRRIIEDFTKNTRFCIICNYVSKIIDPIVSRCAKFRFCPLTRESQLSRLLFISQNENVSIPMDVMKFLIEISEGDLRRAINLMQSISQLGEELMTPEVINDVCGIIPMVEIETIFEIAKTQKIDVIMQYSNNFLAAGYDLRQFLSQLNEYVINRPDLIDYQKWVICELIMDKETALMENSSPHLLFYSLMTDIMKTFTLQ